MSFKSPIALFLLAVFVVFGIAVKTTIEVHNKEDLRTLTCGWPLEFVENDQDWRDREFPYTIHCISGELQDPRIDWKIFFVNVLMFYLAFILLWETYLLIRKTKVK